MEILKDIDEFISKNNLENGLKFKIFLVIFNLI